MRSAIYVGQVMHSRIEPVRHRFAYRVFSLYLDLDELDAASRRLRLFSRNRFNIFGFYDRDHGDGRRDIRDWAVQKLLESAIEWTGGSIRLLCFPRILGFVFNPLSIYYCFDRSERLVALIHEVHNTAGERHSYVLPVDAYDTARGRVTQNCDKAFYVSPFIPMDADYAFRLRIPGDTISLLIRERSQGRELLRATLSGRRAPLDDRKLLRLFASHPLMTLKVVAAIHWQALRLFAKGVRVFPRGRVGAAIAKLQGGQVR